MRMITSSEDKRRFGLSASQAISIILGCTMFVLVLLAMLPET
jgi:hypothetical protein